MLGREDGEMVVVVKEENEEEEVGYKLVQPCAVWRIWKLQMQERRSFSRTDQSLRKSVIC